MKLAISEQKQMPMIKQMKKIDRLIAKHLLKQNTVPTKNKRTVHNLSKFPFNEATSTVLSIGFKHSSSRYDTIRGRGVARRERGGGERST